MTNEGTLFRIIDVNLNRAREGLRVVEEICRFILEDQQLTLKIKKVRGDLSKGMKAHEGPRGERGLKARRAMEDVGRELYTKNEGRRTNVAGVFWANMKRAQEAVRCLEEFSKLIDSPAGKRFKAVRFALYELEKKISLKLEKAAMIRGAR